MQDVQDHASMGDAKAGPAGWAIRPKILVGWATVHLAASNNWPVCSLFLGTVENHGKNGKKNVADFCENSKNHGKNTAKTWHQITGPKTIIQSIKFNIQHCRPSLHAVQGFHL